MTSDPGAGGPDVFVSYASRDIHRVVEIVQHLEKAGITIWRDQKQIPPGECYGPEIVKGIEGCKVVLLMCSAASMRSRNVKQEILLAWHYQRPYVPLLLDSSIGQSYPKQVQYWLEGCQWIEVLDRPPDEWLPPTLQSLAQLGSPAAVTHEEVSQTSGPPAALATPAQGLAELRRLAAFTDQIWPVPADAVRRGVTRGASRGLGAPQPNVQHGHRLGSRLRLSIESDRESHLLLLDEGPEGILYCLCPSWFAPETHLPAGKSVLPQEKSPYDSFLVTGVPGREQLLAILTEQPCSLDWMPSSAGTPARVLDGLDIAALLKWLHALPGDSWTALATYFDVTD